MEYLWIVLFFALFFGVAGLIGAAVAWSIRRVLRAGGIDNALLGGTIVRSFDELPARPPVTFIKSVVRVHRVQTDSGPLIGVLVTHRGPGFWRRTGFALDGSRCAELIEQLRLASTEE
jgi:hypothetical protein